MNMIKPKPEYSIATLGANAPFNEEVGMGGGLITLLMQNLTLTYEF